MDAGLLAIKRPDQAKQRLGKAFTKSQRIEIAGAMSNDALDLCARADFLTWWVVTDGAEAARAADELGFHVVMDDGAGLNPALLKGLAAIDDAGVDSVTIIPADIPGARSEELQDVLDTGETSQLVVVPSGDGGTNALYLRPPTLVEPRFGQGSLQAHLHVAEEQRIRCSVLPLESMALDIDTPEDVERFLEEGAGSTTRTYEVLSRLRLPPTTAES
jgi:2-phospho-L-lactate guanylyltransferase